MSTFIAEHGGSDLVTDTVRENIFKTHHRHIVFGVNTEGYNDSGFAGQVSSSDWPELANTGPKQLGEVMSKKTEGRVYHAIVCHSLEGGWDGSPVAIEKALNALDVPDDEEIAAVLMGGGPIGQMQGADVNAILAAIGRSKKKVRVFTR